jgi:hypothetical protein
MLHNARGRKKALVTIPKVALAPKGPGLRREDPADTGLVQTRTAKNHNNEAAAARRVRAH